MSADDLVARYLETGELAANELAALPAEDRSRVSSSQPDLDRIRAALENPALWQEPAAGLQAAIVDAILAEPVMGEPVMADPVGAQPDPDPTAGHPRLPDGSPAVTSLELARLRRTRAVAIGATVVAAAAIIVAVIGISTRPGPPADQSAFAGNPGSGAPVVPTTIDDALELTVTGSALVPAAEGTVRLKETESGVWIRLDVAGLPRRDGGEFYQAWAKTEDGLVPIGTFHTGEKVVLWSGVSIDDMSAITVTLERNDANQESSGERALVATVPDVVPAPGTRPSGRTGSVPGSVPS